MQTNILKFVINARKKGFNDYEIKETLFKKGMSLKEVEAVFKSLPPQRMKHQISILLDSEVLKIIEKRAKRNFLSAQEQIEDILRRSCVNAKKLKKEEEKLDDMLISLFSRRR